MVSTSRSRSREACSNGLVAILRLCLRQVQLHAEARAIVFQRH